MVYFEMDMIFEECVLHIELGDNIDQNIGMAWTRDLPWEDHIKSLDYLHITRVVYNSHNGSTTIHFSNPEYKSWFIVRWS